jgi:hypothetical protein
MSRASRLRLSRRALLKGAGSIAIALPWLEIMERERADAQAGTAVAPGASADGGAKRFLAVYTPGGTVQDKFWPSGSESAFTLSPILAPLESIKSKLLVLQGLDMKSAIGEQHQAGIVAWLSGTPQSGSHRQYASGPSIDQVIATRIGKDKAKRSLELAVRWATGKSHGLLHPINSINFEDNGNFNPIPPRLDPVAIYDDLFGSLQPNGQTTEARARLQRKQSILDFVGRRYERLLARVGTADRQKLEQHLTKIREIEHALSAQVMLDAACRAPERVDTSDYDPTTGLNSTDDGSIRDNSTDAAIPKVGKLMIDMLVMAMACDITAVGTLQWSDTEAKHTFPWLDLREHHHFYQHDGGFRPAECEKIGTWYSEQHAYLLNAMDQVDMGGHSLLDESVVFFGSELADPPSHNKNSMPFLLAGGGGGLRGGRWLKYDRRPHNDLLVSILNLFGDTRERFGSSDHCTGPLGNLA